MTTMTRNSMRGTHVFIYVSLALSLIGQYAISANATTDMSINTPLGVTPYPASYFQSAQPNNAREMIDRLPGFIFDPGGEARGFADSVGNVLIDGTRPTSKSDGISSYLRRIPAAQVERIDVIRGGASGIDMRGKSVIANVIRKTAAASTALVGVAATRQWGGGPLFPEIRIEGTHTGLARSLEGSMTTGTHFDEESGAGREIVTAPNGASISRTEDTVSGRVRPLVATVAFTDLRWGGRFRLNAQVTLQNHSSDETDRDELSDGSKGAIETEHIIQKSGEIGFSFDRSFGAKLSTEIAFLQKLATFADVDVYTSTGERDNFFASTRISETIFQSNMRYAWSDCLSLHGGNEFDLNRLASRATYLSAGEPIILPAADTRVEETRIEPSAKAVWKVGPRLTIDAELRIEYSHLTAGGDIRIDRHFPLPKPRLMLTLNPSALDQVRVRLERQVDQLDFQDFIANSELTTGQVYAGNPNLVPQQSWVIEAANQWSFSKSGDLTVTYRHSDIKNVLDRGIINSDSGAFDSPANIGKGKKRELITAIALPIDRFGVHGGLVKGQVTWRQSSVNDPITGRQRSISGVRSREGTLEFAHDLDRWHMNWGVAYDLGWSLRVHRYYDTELYGVRHSAKIFVEQKPHPQLSLRAELNNIGVANIRALNVFANAQYSGATTYVDRRDLAFGPTVSLRANYTL